MEKSQNEISDKNYPPYNPKYLYKFYKPTIDNLNDIRNRKIWLANPINFNDPFDCRISKLSILEDELTEKIENKKFKKSKFNNKRFSYHKTEEEILEFKKILSDSKNEASIKTEKLKKKIDEKEYRVTCLSKFHNDSLLTKRSDMWAYYAMDATGFCVSYDRNLIFKNNLTLDKKIYEVTYTNNILSIPQNIDRIEEFIIKSYCRKTTNWSHEKEFRLILEENDTKNGKIDFPYAANIYIGCRATPSTVDELINIGKQLKIPVYQLKIYEDKMIINTAKSNY